MNKKLDSITILKEGLGIGLKNLPSVIGAAILWALTIWIPYINVGTTIALASLPVSLSRGNVISPLEIFDAKYRENMGEFFLLSGFITIGVYSAMAFLIIPGIVIGLAWMLAIPIFIDLKLSPLQAIRKSNDVMDGNKMPVFLGLILLPSIALGIIISIAMNIGIIGLILILIAYLAFIGIMIGGQAYIYRELIVNKDSNESNNLTSEDILDQ